MVYSAYAVYESDRDSEDFIDTIIRIVKKKLLKTEENRS